MISVLEGQKFDKSDGRFAELALPQRRGGAPRI